jgi:hypothetical protein
VRVASFAARYSIIGQNLGLPALLPRGRLLRDASLDDEKPYPKLLQMVRVRMVVGSSVVSILSYRHLLCGWPVRGRLVRGRPVRHTRLLRSDTHLATHRKIAGRAVRDLELRNHARNCSKHARSNFSVVPYITTSFGHTTHTHARRQWSPARRRHSKTTN